MVKTLKNYGFFVGFIADYATKYVKF